MGAFSLSFSLSRESESCFNFFIIAVFLKFVSVLEKGLRPLVLAINVSKFLPASSCSNRLVGIRSYFIFHSALCSNIYGHICHCVGSVRSVNSGRNVSFVRSISNVSNL